VTGGGHPYVEPVTSDALICTRLRAGDRTAARELLDRDHAVAAFFARVVAGGDDEDGGAQAERADTVLAGAWESLVDDVLTGKITDGLRTALLRSVALALRVDGPDEQPAVSAPYGTFNPAGDRWEGWWQDEPPAWPPDAVPRREQVLGALRRLSRRQRAVLVLRETAKLTVTQVGEVVDGGGNLEHLLESARDAYLVELDREVGSA
jgi:DNA-directed RNA polymerase specialized sigma24 family protein